MKMSIGRKILSVFLSVMFLGSGFIHLMIHSGGPCAGEAGHDLSLSASRTSSSLLIQETHPSDKAQAANVFCQICAGMFNFILTPEFFRMIETPPETNVTFVSNHPVISPDWRLPLSRAPPLS